MSVKVYASAKAWEILSEAKHIDTINQFSRQLTERMKIHVPYAAEELDWPVGLAGDPISEGDVIDLGNRQIRVLETPGHSSCSISAYVPQIKALFPSDGGGIPYKGTIIASANSNFTLYLESRLISRETSALSICSRTDQEFPVLLLAHRLHLLLSAQLFSSVAGQGGLLRLLLLPRSLLLLLLLLLLRRRLLLHVGSLQQLLLRPPLPTRECFNA
jgi:hypothetical protein